ncbi:MAG TPA: DNA gyrase modulator, partial [Candidatus Tumulicola sp.]|nr:DNA gyrase modulator [Candidatus Tumulicola sp.]
MRFPMQPVNAALPRIDVKADFWSLRFVDETSEAYCVRKNVAQPLALATDRGVMASVYADGGYGYAATADTSPAGLRAALDRAAEWARASAKLAITDSRTLPRPAARGQYESPALASPLPDARGWFELLHGLARDAGCDARIVDWDASVDVIHSTQRLVTSEGGDVVQRFRMVIPSVGVTAHADGVTQQRSLNGQRGICQQGG